jgi:hypothetical protein
LALGLLESYGKPTIMESLEVWDFWKVLESYGMIEVVAVITVHFSNNFNHSGGSPANPKIILSA